VFYINLNFRSGFNNVRLNSEVNKKLVMKYPSVSGSELYTVEYLKETTCLGEVSHTVKYALSLLSLLTTADVSV
jgi:hypothetical protein